MSTYSGGGGGGAELSDVIPTFVSEAGAAGNGTQAARDNHIHGGPVPYALPHNDPTWEIPGWSSSGQGVATLTAGRAYFTLIYVPRTITYDRMAIYVSANIDPSLVRLGIYNDNGAGQAGTLLVDAGTVNAATPGAKEITISQELGPGWYWLVVVADAALGLSSSTGSTVAGDHGKTPPFTSPDGTMINPIFNHWVPVLSGRSAWVGGGLPDPCPTMNGGSRLTGEQFAVLRRA